MTQKELLKLKENLQEALDLVNKELKLLCPNERIDTEPSTKHMNEIKVTRCMRMLGIPANLAGYNYIRTAIVLCLEDTTRLHNVTKRLYPDIASRYSTTPSNVERGIRHAIEVAWSRGKQEARKEIFGYSVSHSKGRPTNSEFVSALTDWIGMNKDKVL